MDKAAKVKTMEEKIVKRFESEGYDYYVIKVPMTETETGKEVLCLQIVRVISTIQEYDLR